MELMTILHEPEGRAAIDQLASQLGIDRGQAEAAVTSVLPRLAEQLERNTLSRGGLADLVSLLGAAQRASSSGLAFDSAAAIAQPEATAHGNALLEHILGGKEASRAIAARAAASSGLGASIIEAMLPYIARMVIGSLARRTSGGLGDILAKIPGGAAAGAGGHAPMQQPVPAGGGLTLPDGFPGLFPTGGGTHAPPGAGGTPAPGQNPYGDLSDIIRRGGPTASVGGNPLWSVVRGILGGALGFQSRGIVGWLFRLLVMRWGWSLAQRILSRVFLGR